MALQLRLQLDPALDMYIASRVQLWELRGQYRSFSKPRLASKYSWLEIMMSSEVWAKTESFHDRTTESSLLIWQRLETLPSRAPCKETRASRSAVVAPCGELRQPIRRPRSSGCLHKRGQTFPPPCP
jgi:hypothetical protein